MARQQYSEEIKAAVLAGLAVGSSYATLAAQYGVPEGTIKSWQSRQGSDDGVATVATVATERRHELGALLGDYLTELLKTLAVQARTLRDEGWLKEQSAAELAVLHGGLADKAIRILGALEPADDPDSPGGDGAA